MFLYHLVLLVSRLLLCDCFKTFHLTGSLTHEAREAFLSALVSEGMLNFYLWIYFSCNGSGKNVSTVCSGLTGRAEWMDKGHRKCLILWHRIQDWADILIQFVGLNY